jgi:hypothetical protein
MRMDRLRLIWIILALCAIAATRSALADGMVLPEIYFPKVEIPNQQAFIQCANGVERLVIETSFLGEGTNFAWVVPLPAPPEVRAASADFFVQLRQAFQPQLVHRVHPYYAGILFFCGLVFLGWRALRDDTSLLIDLPLCLALGVGAGLMARNVFAGAVAGVLALCTRIFGRTQAVVALFLLLGAALGAALTFTPSPSEALRRWGLIETLGGGEPEGPAPGVSEVSVQHAGVFDSTTIQGTNPNAVRVWLSNNGYQVPGSAERALRYYVDHGWVFVASKVRRIAAGREQVALHPLLFTFAARAPVYPTRLTAVNSGACAIDLYVFGERRATARHFDTVRCDRLAGTAPQTPRRRLPGLALAQTEVLSLIGKSTVGTKLSGRLSPKQMASDVDVHSGVFWRSGARVFSYSGAVTIALNFALPLAVIGWLLAGASRGGWKVTEAAIWRSRRWLLAGAVGLGLAVFFLLPKVEVESRTVSGDELTASQR